MQGAIDFFKRGIQRVNARIAILVVVVAAGGVAAWQGFSHMASHQPKTGPKKEIATGVSPPDAGGAPASTAPPSTLPPSAPVAGEHRLIGYGQTDTPAAMPSTAPPSNPYLPQANDPASGYGGAFATLQPPAASPPTTSPPTNPAAGQAATNTISDESIPENEYRRGSASSIGDAPATSLPLAQSPYGPPPTASGESAAPVVDPPATRDLNPAASGGGYGDYARGAAPNPDAPSYSPPAALPAASVPPNPLPAADLSGSPYGESRSAIGSMISRSDLPAPLPGKLAAATPGERQLEGPQQPAISVEKVSPAEIQVGKQATFELYVRNTGPVAAHQVVVTDHVPAGTQLVDARPQPQQAADGSLVWSLGTMQPGEETQITLQVMPQTEGEIGSTAQVSFAAAATSRSICTRPQLTIEHAAVPKVLIGESFNVEITISNPGSGPATGVRIEEDVPAGLTHAAGAQLEYEVGTLRPGESKRLALVLTAKQAGQVQNVIHAKGDGGLAAQHALQLEVVAPLLTVDVVDGPKRRTLQRQATYTLQIANPGTAAARDVELVAFLPRGMKFVATDAQGQYDAAQHAVFWSLEELPPAKAGAVKLTTLPVEPGEQRLRVEGRADLGLTAASEQMVQVEQSAEVVFTVKDVDEVIEVGSETTYEIRVTNTGTKAATNVRIAAQLPPGMAAINGEGPTRAGGDATQITFEPLARLNPQEEVIYKVQVQGKQPGDHKISVQLASDEWPTPVIREESTRVYLDR
jgi:uncharacterized repeat protein (TIGR01451 family)